MADLTLTSKNPTTLRVDALVLATASTPKGPELVGASELPKPLRQQLEGSLKVLGVTGKADDVHRVPAGEHVKASVIVLTGTGDKTRGPLAAETLRRATGAATRNLSGMKSAALALPAPDAEAVAAIAEGALLGAYAYTTYRTGANVSAPLATIELVTDRSREKTAKAAAERAAVIADAVAGARDLINTSPLDLFPAAFADRAKAAARGTGVKFSVLDEKGLVEGGFGGIMGVGQGSTRLPRLVTVTYAPSKPAAKIALVGKGITFDSGGISIKPAAGMDAMKSDMSGAAAVLHTVLAAAKLQLPVAVTGYLAIAENMPSGSAIRPSDVLTMRGGKTVEVLNTDAEGRLVMGDAIVLAGESKPDVIIDIATLTGAQMVALGTRVSAVMGDDAVRNDLVAAAGVSGEQFWPMPLPVELRASMDSKVADIANIGDRFGGMLVAGLFLKEFAGDTPWGHLDIAGPAFNEGSAHGYTPLGGTGVGVRTLLSYIESKARR